MVSSQYTIWHFPEYSRLHCDYIFPSCYGLATRLYVACSFGEVIPWLPRLVLQLQSRWARLGRVTPGQDRVGESLQAGFCTSQVGLWAPYWGAVRGTRADEILQISTLTRFTRHIRAPQKKQHVTANEDQQASTARRHQPATHLSLLSMRRSDGSTTILRTISTS